MADQMQKVTWLDEIWHLGVFRVAGAWKFEKLPDYAENSYTKVYRVADYESDLRFSRFNMANPRWWQKLEKIIEFFYVSVSCVLFFGLLITNLIFDSYNSR